MLGDSIAANGKISAGADFAAGLVMGLTAVNHLEEIEACMTGGELMFSEVDKAIADIKDGGLESYLMAAFEFGLVAVQVPEALRTCKSMGDDIAAIESWASIFKDRSALVATVTKHYLFHKKEINGDIA